MDCFYFFIINNFTIFIKTFMHFNTSCFDLVKNFFFKHFNCTSFTGNTNYLALVLKTDDMSAVIYKEII